MVGESAAVTDEVTGQPNRPFAPGNSGEQRRCQQGCRGKPKSPIKIRGCENKCLELGDEDARSIADFLQNEDAELIANFIQDIFDVKDSEESFDVEDSEDSFVEVMHRYCDRGKWQKIGTFSHVCVSLAVPHVQCPSRTLWHRPSQRRDFSQQSQLDAFRFGTLGPQRQVEEGPQRCLAEYQEST